MMNYLLQMANQASSSAQPPNKRVRVMPPNTGTGSTGILSSDYQKPPMMHAQGLQFSNAASMSQAHGNPSLHY